MKSPTLQINHMKKARMNLFKRMAFICASLVLTFNSFGQTYTDPVDNHDGWSQGWALLQVKFLESDFSLTNWNNTYYDYMFVDGDFEYVHNGATVAQPFTVSDFPIGVPVTIETLYGNNLTNYGVWIDINGDKDFDDEGEFVKSHNGYWNGASDKTVTIPLGTAPGDVRMRVRDCKSNESLVAGDHTRDLGVFTQSVDILIHMVESAPVVASAPVPFNGKYDQAVDGQLSWTNGALTDNLDLYLSTTKSDVENQVAEAKVLTSSTETSYTFSGLDEATEYFWGVVSHNENGDTPGAVWSFITHDSNGPAVADNAVPADNATEVTVNGNLTWQTTDEVIAVDVYFSDNIEDVTNLSAGCRVINNEMLNSYALTNLVGSTDYYWRVVTRKSASSLTVGPVLKFTTQVWYCYPVEHYWYSGYGLNKVVLNDLNNETTFGENAYNDYSELSANVFAGGEVNLTVGVAQNSKFVSVYIDYNNDKQFSEEEAIASDEDITNEKVITFTVGDVDEGDYRMRVISSLYAEGTACLALTYNQGETEDYTLSVSEGSVEPGQASNPVPANGNENVNLVLDKLNWTNGANISAVDVYFGTDNSALVKVVDNELVTEYTINPALEASTKYFWRVDSRSADQVVAGETWSFTTNDGVVAYADPIDNHEGWSGDVGYCITQIQFLQSDFTMQSWNDTYYDYIYVDGDYEYTYNGSVVPQSFTVSDVPVGASLKLNKVSGNNMNNYGIWVDFNRDGDFEDEGEFVKHHKGYWNSVGDSTFMIPATAVAGPTRMRIRDSKKSTDLLAGDHTADLGAITQSVDILINLFVAQAAENPMPFDGAYAIAVDSTLNWTMGAATDKVDVYFSTNKAAVQNKEAAAKVITNSDVTTYSPDAMTAATTYYWRVCGMCGDVELNSPVWSFSTVDPSGPAVATTPAPAHQANDIEVNPTLSWINSEATQKVDVFFSENLSMVENRDFSCRIVEDQNVATLAIDKPLNGEKTYYWCVVAKGADPQQVTVGDVWSFTTEPWYCLPVEHILSPKYGISSVKITDPNSGTVLLEKTSGIGEDIYFDYSDLSAALIAGGSYEITMAGGEKKAATGVWIDFNNDMTFDNATERIFAKQIDGTPQTETFTVPADAVASIRMRVVAIDYYLSSCIETTNHYAETEDYTVTVETLDADAGVAEILMTAVQSPQIVTPKARVFNFGSSTASFQVTATNGDGFTSVQQVTDLPSTDTVLVTFDDWDMTLGAYNLKVFTQQTGDLQHLNDTLSMNVFACDHERQNVLVEILTGTWCGYCPGAAMGADDLVSNGKNVSIIEYHSGDSYTNDEGQVHIDRFAAPGLPSAFFDGTTRRGGGSHTQSMYSVYLPIYETALAVPTAYTMGYSIEEVNDSKYNVSVNVNDLYDYQYNGLKLYVALVESEIEKEWQGQTKLDFVERKMYPDGNGFELDFSSKGSVENSFIVEIPAEYNKEHCQLVAFVQDPATLITWETFSAPIEATQPSGTFALIHNGTEIDNGATLDFSGFTTDEEIVAHLSIKNTADASKAVLVKKEVIESTEGHANTFCWGDCFPPNVNQSTSALTIDAGAVNSDDFSGHVMPNNVMGVTKIKYTFFEEENEENAVYFIANFNADIDYINELSAAVKVYPNPANSLLNISGVENVTFVTVMNTVGQVVYNMNCEGDDTIQLNVTDYPQGIYMVKLEARDGQTAVKRIVITK